MDARQRKTRAKLSEVILRLAAERPASDLTVSEITVAAGINRSTFYQHAASPVELLEDVLREELDAIRDRFLPVTPSVASNDESITVSAVSPSDIRDVTAAVIEHVGFHSTLYSRALGATSGASSLHPMLSRHFAESVTQLLSLHGVRMPQDDSPARHPTHMSPNRQRDLLRMAPLGPSKCGCAPPNLGASIRSSRCTAC